ncbi:DUF927 domain-containing protein [Deinococcus knuensis]|uniref:DUF927 domain-containing protein n=1 Tax=Deinococcus knuensis TaxID=1837380 RepID=A0ABQ2SD77_9DEIO|nr:DUF927 domain-containing protein [Deinococcus knuensis]GGS14572.1 hypothetical protein GCM10008961_02290 [Deinococcus knuensis]
MSALTDALEALTPGAVLRNLAAYLGKSAPHLHSEMRGEVCDFRPGQEEENPSLSYGRGTSGPVFHRFGGDGFEGGAVAFLESAGLAKGEAARLLLEWAGVKDEPGERGTVPSSRPAPVDRKAARLAKADAALSKLRPLEAGKHGAALRGWEPLQAGDTHPEALELARRGLSPALASGLLTAYRWTGKVQGGKARPLARHILRGAVAFEVTGPDGTPWAVKARNPGGKEDLKEAKAQRYVYVSAGQSTPAMCGPGQDSASRFLIVEGELNAVACVLMLEAVAHLEAARGWAVQGVASVAAVPHVAHLPAGAQVYVYADPDPEGNVARVTWAELLTARGCQVFQVGGDVSPFAVEGKADADACDALGTVGQGADPEGHAAHVGARLLGALEAARPWKPEPAQEDAAQVTGGDGEEERGDVWLSKRAGYGVRDGRLCALTLKKDPDSGEETEVREQLCNFAAFITAQVRQDEGQGEAARVFEVEGYRATGAPFQPARVTVPVAEFDGMRWPLKEWGALARVEAGNGKKDKARAAIQALSEVRGIEERTVYAHTGWTVHPEHGPVFLTAGAVIGARGAVPGVEVNLDPRGENPRLNAYALPDPAGATGEEMRAAVRASLSLMDAVPDTVGVPMLGGAYRAALGRFKGVVFPTGETGRNKTAFTLLCLYHYGTAWRDDYLPDAWNSTANTLERTAFILKDVLTVFDDFKPEGTQVDRAKMQGTLARILHGAGDGTGRGRMSADGRTRAGYYPRGLVLTSSEGMPRGQSNTARTVVVEVTAPLIGPRGTAKSRHFDALADAGQAGVYALALAGMVQAVASSFEAVRVGSAAHKEAVRGLSPYLKGAHGRTGDTLADLAYGWQVFLSFALQVGAVQELEAAQRWERVMLALREIAQGQAAHLNEADPVDRALSVLSGLLASGRVFLEDLRGGGAPPVEDAALCGYSVQAYRGEHGEEETARTRPGASLVGWYSRTGGDTWGHFLPDNLHAALQDAVKGQGVSLPDAGTLWRNMAGQLQGPGLMRCEAAKKDADGRVTQWRPMFKAVRPDTGTQERMITLRLPITRLGTDDGINGINGIDTPSSTSDTAFSLIPFSLFLKVSNGINGIEEGQEEAFSSSPVTPAPAPRALTLEDLEGYGEGEDLPGGVAL